MGCWHPLYSGHAEEMAQANKLGLIPKAQTTCTSTLSIEYLNRLDKKTENYIRESIASETEFPITNGRTKIIRLPKGAYRYAIKQNSGPFSEEFSLPENKIAASGSIKWVKKRPHVVIRIWLLSRNRQKLYNETKHTRILIKNRKTIF